MEKKAIIIGAGPAGLTAAYELLQKTDIWPIVLEADNIVGGISRTINYKGNRIDIGGHRFFSKSDRVMNWWYEILPLQCTPARESIQISYQGKTRPIKTGDGPHPDKSDKVLLIRKRLSRILFMQKFFSYPISLSIQTFKNLGLIRVIKICIAYFWIRLFPIKKEQSLEDFFINRFGRELYNTFFRDYTKKVWGRPASKIPPEWGAQRVKGVSISKVIIHAIKNIFKKNTDSISQKNIETSLIDQFLYPKFGPGQMWEEVAKKIQKRGGRIIFNKKVISVEYHNKKIISVTTNDGKTTEKYTGDYFFSTMPIKDLILAMGDVVPVEVQEVAKGLQYRDFIVVGLLLKKLSVGKERLNMIPDNWVYIQEPNVKVGRLQIFNNWSPYLVNNPKNVWIGLEYFCNKGDDLWNKSDEKFLKFAIQEMIKINVIKKEDVLDGTVIRMEKTYPSYFGTYDKLDIIKNFTNNIANLFLIGRNGMHRYNNQDHSMLTAMEAVKNIAEGKTQKDNIWEINTEEEYHEKK